MGDIVNLRRARKQRDKRERESEAQANRLTFGRPKAERRLNEASAKLERSKLDAHRLDGGSRPLGQSE